MIVVIADDITGAAELAGIGLRFGLRVELSNEANVAADLDLLVIYTNTRSMTEAGAVAVMEGLTKTITGHKPSLLYKKTDSVLRGHVLAELEAQMAVLHIRKALLVPVNPALGRTIEAGRYYINGQPVHQTAFSVDPEFPVSDPGVAAMLGDTAGKTRVLEPGSDLPSAGIIIGAAKTTADVEAWAVYADQAVLFAGGASFFSALLKDKLKREEAKAEKKARLSSPLLLVSGTTYGPNVARIQAFPHVAVYMPAAVFCGTDICQPDLEEWGLAAVACLETHGVCVLAIDQRNGRRADPVLLGEKISEAIKLILERTTVRELLVEGGSTAYAILKNLGWTSLLPTEELAQGVVRMKVGDVADLHLTIKPGSYDWPPEWLSLNDQLTQA